MCRDAGRRGLRRAGILLPSLLLGVWAATAFCPAGEPMSRGRNAKVVFVDAAGQRQEVAGKEIRYGYYRRVYLKVPHEGKSFRDEEHLEKGLPFAEEFLRFSLMERVDLSRRTDPDSGAQRLELTITLPSGRTRQGRGSTLAGATHPRSPFIQYELDGEERRIELLPLAPDSQRQGKPELVSLDFAL